MSGAGEGSTAFVGEVGESEKHMKSPPATKLPEYPDDVGDFITDACAEATVERTMLLRIPAVEQLPRRNEKLHNDGMEMFFDFAVAKASEKTNGQAYPRHRPQSRQGL